MTYPGGRGSVSVSEVIDADLVYPVRHIHQIGCENKSRIYPSRPWRMICLDSGYVAAMHAALVYLRHITIRSGGIDLNRIGDLVAIHWLREMDLE